MEATTLVDYQDSWAQGGALRVRLGELSRIIDGRVAEAANLSFPALFQGNQQNAQAIRVAQLAKRHEEVPILKGRTRPGKCCASSSSTNGMGEWIVGVQGSLQAQQSIRAK